MLIDFARDRGATVDTRQLKRWRSRGLMPSRAARRRSLGRGQGVRAEDPPWAKHQVLAVLSELQRDRSADNALLRLWFHGWDVETERVRVVLDKQLAHDRDRFARLQEDAEATSDGSAFAAAELDSDSHPVTREETRRMLDVASDGSEGPRELARSVRIAMQGQLLSPPDEPLAINIELVAPYLGLPAGIESLFAQLEGDFLAGVEFVMTQIQRLEPSAALRTPTTEQLDSARADLHLLLYAFELLDLHAPELPLELGPMQALANSVRRYDPNSPDHTIEALRAALRFASARPLKSVQFEA